MTFEYTQTKRFPIPKGLYTGQFIEILAMAIHLDLITGHELFNRLQKDTHDAIQSYLEGLIRANAPAYNARR